MEIPTNFKFTEANFRLLQQLIVELSDRLSALEKENVSLRLENAELKSKLNKDSHNSSKPPSSDGLKKKVINLRKSSGRKPGGQQGHQGSTLQFDGRVDRTLYYLPEYRCSCGQEYEVTNSRAHYVVDLPVIKPEITVHHTHSYRCTHCGAVYQDPSFQGAKIQYGSGLKGLAIYLKNYQLLPYNRISEFFRDCFSCSISPGSLSNFEKQAKSHLSGFEEFVKDKLQSSEVIHSDETGLRVAGSTHWMHVASNEKFTAYHLDHKRGKEAIDRAGILHSYQGTVVHDRFASYFGYPCQHGLCNAHILRELIHIQENYQVGWAQQLIDLLIKTKQRVDRQTTVSKSYRTRTKNRFKKIVRQELALLDKVAQKEKHVRNPPVRGKPKRSEAHNLLLALNKYHKEVLAFLTNPAVPFDNNQAERDLRMIKTKQKVSGCFRSMQAGEAFATIRGFISTLKKQQINLIDGFKIAFQNSEYLIQQLNMAE